MNYPFSPPNGDEEDLNQQFAGFLQYSLEIDSSLINRIHSDDPIDFTDDAKLIAHQNAPLPTFTETGPDREIDWVVGDQDKIVGYESKYGDSLGKEQLSDELDKLHLNAEGRDVKLVAITPHTTPPEVIDEFAEDSVHWLSWITVSRRLTQATEKELPPEQRPLLRILKDLFEAEDMHPFTGFNHHDKQQYRYFIRDLRQELQDTELENRDEIHSWTTNDPDPPSYRRIVPKYLEVPFVRESRTEDGSTKRASYMSVALDLETHEVHTGIVFNVRQEERHEEFVSDNIDELVEFAAEQDLQLWASMNSPNQWPQGVPKTDSPAEMRTWLENGGSNAIAVEDTNYKKARFVTKSTASEPAELIQQAKDDLLKFYEQFLLADDLYPWPTLSGHE